MKPILIEISPGELIDRISILRLKLRHQAQGTKQAQLRRELDSLAIARESLPSSPKLESLAEVLAAVNERLWQIEDEIRDCERRGDFGTSFIELARDICQNNDRRSALKKQINEILGAHATDEKLYSTRLA